MGQAHMLMVVVVVAAAGGAVSISWTVQSDHC
jgi:flagellar basal body-associated protein FliL